MGEKSDFSEVEILSTFEFEIQAEIFEISTNTLTWSKRRNHLKGDFKNGS